ncbi:aldo/keto reductase [Rhodobacter sp. KR11]|uniref:aldo/keto reductase n=1 Tax=Rhodobacter sp. KR11 TaxID=2974588 RepID=UPI002223C75B|nr:aldo/keto reductase [Rhodobacter sp. KR11]MCW1918808.1 aldo/keto reductase [Rhodobacter sp. KR11]
MTIRWGIIGPGSIANNFADGLAQSTSGKLVAVAGRDAARRQAFAGKYGLTIEHETYQGLMADPGVDAVYISTPHPWHAELSIAALRAGKHVLCEKPAGMNSAEVVAVCEVAAQEGRFFMEAFMYRCHPQIARVLEIIASGEIGTPRHIRTQFGFNAPYRAGSRLYEMGLGGGGILDVGGYPVSLARLIAGAAEGKGFANPTVVRGHGVLAETGVDAVAHGILGFSSGFVAEIAVAVARNMDNSALITGDLGTILIADPWVPGRNVGPSTTSVTVTVGGTSRVETLGDHRMLFAFEAEAVSATIAAGGVQGVHPAPTHADSIGNNETLDRWRAEVGYRTFAEQPATNRKTPGVLPKGLASIPKAALAGVNLPVSKLILGCDNRNTVAEGALVWDAFMEAGGNAFDTGFVYGGGLHEKVLGDWIRARGVSREVVVVAKGAHTPYCNPDSIGAQLEISLDRLGLDFAPIYIMHRDNPGVPVGEFVDALNVLKARGRIGIFGGSNWTPRRMAEANIYATKHGLQGFGVLNNNLSLAVMEKPVWAGCVTSNTPETLGFLRRGGLAHLSWSSQARGYFLPEDLRNRLPADTAPETCFGSPANAERRRRAELLAAEKGVSAHNIATAWVLSQSFPSFALIGPRSPGEIVSTLAGAALELSAAEVLWLNLEGTR